MTVNPQEVVSKYKALLKENNNLQQNQWASAFVNGNELQNATVLTNKTTNITQRRKKKESVIQSFNLVKILLFKDNKLWIGGDRSEPQEVFDIESLPDDVVFNEFTTPLKLSNTGLGLDDWLVTGLLTDGDFINPSYSVLIITPEGFEITPINEIVSPFWFLGDGYVGGSIGEQRFIYGLNKLPFPLKAQKAYYDHLTGNFINIEAASFESVGQTLEFDINESASYTSTSVVFECNKVAASVSFALGGRLLMRTGNIQILNTVYFGVEEGGELPAPLQLNTPYTVARRANETANDGILVAPYTTSGDFIPTDQLINVTTTGSNFYAYIAGVVLDSSLYLVGLDRTSYLIFEGEPDPEYNPVEATSGNTIDYLRLANLRLIRGNDSILYSRDTTLNINGFDIPLGAGVLPLATLIGDNIVFLGEGSVSISNEDEVTSVSIIVATLNNDGTISTNTVDAEFIAPSDRFDEDEQLTYIEKSVGLYAEA